MALANPDVTAARTAVQRQQPRLRQQLRERVEMQGTKLDRACGGVRIEIVAGRGELQPLVGVVGNAMAEEVEHLGLPVDDVLDDAGGGLLDAPHLDPVVACASRAFDGGMQGGLGNEEFQPDLEAVGASLGRRLLEELPFPVLPVHLEGRNDDHDADRRPQDGGRPHLPSQRVADASDGRSRVEGDEPVLRIAQRLPADLLGLAFGHRHVQRLHLAGRRLLDSIEQLRDGRVRLQRRSHQLAAGPDGVGRLPPGERVGGELQGGCVLRQVPRCAHDPDDHHLGAACRVHHAESIDGDDGSHHRAPPPELPRLFAACAATARRRSSIVCCAMFESCSHCSTGASSSRAICW
jgi:hypothetical protein